jgi:octaprenyl-diphosphate synthase
LIKNKKSNPENVRELVNLAVEKGGIEYASQKMAEFKDKAVAALREFPANPARDSLIELMEYITTREK